MVRLVVFCALTTVMFCYFFFSSRRRHTRLQGDWSSDVCSSDLTSGTRLADVVGLAGGVTPTSYLKRVQVVRALPDAERITLDVDLASHYLRGEEQGNPPINAGDLVLIHRSDPRVYNIVKVEGAVRYPGAYELKPMMRIGQLLPADKLLPEAYAERVEVARRRPDLSMEIV